MPSVPEVLSCLADSLRADGARYAPRPLDVIAAAATFLAATSHPVDGDIAAASYLAAQLRFADAKTAASALSIPANLIPDPRPSLGGEDLKLGRILARGTAAEAAVAATILFSWHTIAAKAGKSNRMAELLTAAKMATDPASQNKDLAKALVTEMGKVLPTTQSPPKPGGRLFSISIDLVGSTDAKTRIMRVAKGDPRKIDEMNGQVYREFCDIERRFYDGAVDRYGNGPPIDPANFFTVKGIGDEIWILCEAADADVAQIGHRLIDAAIEVACRSVQFLAAENDDEGAFSSDFTDGDAEPVRSPIKMFIDLIDHASDLERVRDDALFTAIPNLLKTYHQREPTPLQVAEVRRRMCLSGYEPVGWWRNDESRTDYIGHEIDRFFRTTKSAIPGTVTIGASMAREMGLGFRPVREAIHAVFARDGAALTGGGADDAVYARIRTFESHQLKGIGYAYDTFTLFSPLRLNGLFHGMEAAKDQNIPALPYEETAALIAPSSVRALVEQILEGRKR